MSDIESINEYVEIMCVFTPSNKDRQKCIPRKMKYKNRIINFTELGLCHPTSQGKRMIHVFDMTDGLADYRIEFDAQALTWTLISRLTLDP